MEGWQRESAWDCLFKCDTNVDKDVYVDIVVFVHIIYDYDFSIWACTPQLMEDLSLYWTFGNEQLEAGP